MTDIRALINQTNKQLYDLDEEDNSITRIDISHYANEPPDITFHYGDYKDETIEVPNDKTPTEAIKTFLTDFVESYRE